ncbi:hypothetical protein [Gemmatimonas sp.]|uniref:hypothetical protein n=1 Tax=Gemmatimonas sp. TaxID=1962908 RepID=UPI0037C0DB05
MLSATPTGQNVTQGIREQSTVSGSGAARQVELQLTLPTELRGVAASSGDISAFSASSLAFRSPLGTSFVCARSSSTSVDVPPLETARCITSNWVVTPDAGDTLIALRHDSSGVKGDFWSTHRMAAVSASSALCPSMSYADSLRDVGKIR